MFFKLKTCKKFSPKRNTVVEGRISITVVQTNPLESCFNQTTPVDSTCWQILEFVVDQATHGCFGCFKLSGYSSKQDVTILQKIIKRFHGEICVTICNKLIILAIPTQAWWKVESALTHAKTYFIACNLYFDCCKMLPRCSSHALFDQDDNNGKHLTSYYCVRWMVLHSLLIIVILTNNQTPFCIWDCLYAYQMNIN